MKRFILLFVLLLIPASLFALVDTLSIPEIQGYGSSTPYENDTITTYGIVTAVVPPHNGGYYLQDASCDTFAGIFVFTGTYAYPDVRRGDSVEVTGIVTEFYEMTELGYIQAENILGTATVPTPILSYTGNAGQEKYEGMLVVVISAQCTDDSLGYGEWEVNDGSGAIRIDDQIYHFKPQQGGYYDVTGPLNYSYSDFKIEPRDYRDVLGPGATPTSKSIYDVQYTTEPSGDSPLIDTLVKTYGIVTGIFNDGFYIEEASGGEWNGVYVYSDLTAKNLNRGDSCSVVGNVSEYKGFTEIGNSPVWQIFASGHSLPTPIEITTGGVGESVEGLFVHLDSAVCIASGLQPSGYYYGMSDNAGIDTLLVADLGGDYEYNIGESYELYGLIKTDTFSFVLEPRDSADIVNLSGVEETDITENLNLSISYIGRKIQIQFSIPEQSRVRLSVYDPVGRLIQDLYNGTPDAGRYNIELKSQSLPTGLYFIHLRANSKSRTAKFMVL